MKCSSCQHIYIYIILCNHCKYIHGVKIVWFLVCRIVCWMKVLGGGLLLYHTIDVDNDVLWCQWQVALVDPCLLLIWSVVTVFRKDGRLLSFLCPGVLLCLIPLNSALRHGDVGSFKLEGERCWCSVNAHGGGYIDAAEYLSRFSRRSGPKMIQTTSLLNAHVLLSPFCLWAHISSVCTWYSNIDK